LPTHSTGAAVSQPTHVWDYWAVVMKRILLVIGVCLACVTASYVLTHRQEKLYRSTSTIQILPPNVLGPADAMFTPAIVNDEAYLLTQLAILATPDTIAQAVKENQLERRKDFSGRTEAEIVRLAAGKVECTRRRGLYLVDVSVIGTEKAVLDDLCNALVKTFQSMQKSEARRLRDDLRASLDAARVSADAMISLQRKDKSVALQNQNFSESTFESEYANIQASRERFAKADDELYAELMQEEPVVAAVRQAQADTEHGLDAIARLQFVRRSPRVQQADENLVLLREQRESLQKREKLGPNESRVQALDGDIEKAMRERALAIAAEVERFVSDHETHVRTHEGYQKQIERRTQELNAAAAVKQKVDACNAEIARHQANKDTATRQLEALNQHATDDREAVVIVSPGTEPQTPYSPNLYANLTLGILLGIVGGIALAFLLDYLDDTIRTKDELAKIAPDVPLLGIVPNIEARRTEVAKKDLFAANQPKSTISEAYRGVRTALTLSARGPQQKAMLLTSAGPREGKTTTAINLATVLAFSGARTLIIDADLRKPRVHASFNLPNKRGLTNLIVGDEDPLSVCQRTHVERVDVLTSGPIPPNPSELLGRTRMKEILAYLGEHYDQIIVDTPPIGAVTDAAVIATMVDGVILVVHAGKTRRQIVSRGIEQLRYIGAPIIGVILNNLHLGRGRYHPGYYHYYYYYASHYGAEDGEPRTKDEARPSPPSVPADAD
jgi:succinoglycan biosynthesis transport protein ExoP